jgi:ferredoxin
MTIRADEARCISSGNCAMTLPDIFDQRPDDGVVVVLDAAGTGASRAELDDVVALCPAQALSITDE